MHEHGLSAQHKRRFCKTTDSKHGPPTAPNLLARDFTASAPNQAWVGDITYVPTREGWLYLASRAVVGWAMGPTIDRKLRLSALHYRIGSKVRDAPCFGARLTYQLSLAKEVQLCGRSAGHGGHPKI